MPVIASLWVGGGGIENNLKPGTCEGNLGEREKLMEGLASALE